MLRVSAVVRVRPASDAISAADVAALGRLVEQRCPVAATLAQGGCELDFDWRLDPGNLAQDPP